MGLLAVLISVWLGTNVVVRTFDPPPFVWLQLSMTLVAAVMSVVILTSQRRADRFSAQREQLILQLAFSSEQRAAKIIALIKELRRDDPLIENRPDSQAEAMALPSDQVAVERAIADTRKELVESSGKE